MESNRTEANRKNARKSTGPKTVEGKAAVARNATKHGLLSKQVYRDDHKDAELRALAARLYAQLQPVGAIEDLLVDRIVSNAWRLRRLLEVEAMYQDYKVTRYVDGPFKDDYGHVWSNIESLEKILEKARGSPAMRVSWSDPRSRRFMSFSGFKRRARGCLSLCPLQWMWKCPAWTWNLKNCKRRRKRMALFRK